jgi:hypothetical protein
MYEAPRRLEASPLVSGQAARQRPAGGGNHAAVTLEGTLRLRIVA